MEKQGRDETKVGERMMLEKVERQLWSIFMKTKSNSIEETIISNTHSKFEDVWEKYRKD